jgi:hypothetical protein
MPAAEHSYLDQLPGWSHISWSKQNTEAHVFLTDTII